MLHSNAVGRIQSILMPQPYFLVPVSLHYMATSIQLSNVTKGYRVGQRSVQVFDQFVLQIAAGEFVCLMGRSGSGKSTLLNLVGGLDRADSGAIVVGGHALHTMDENDLARWRRTQVGVVFQLFHLLPSLTALENVLFPMQLGPRLARAVRYERAQHLLAQVGLTAQAHAFPSELSGGEQQRVALARALANDPPLLLADEPTGNLDAATGATILDLLAQLATQGRTLLLATHDQSVRQRATRTIQLG